MLEKSHASEGFWQRGNGGLDGAGYYGWGWSRERSRERVGFGVRKDNVEYRGEVWGGGSCAQSTPAMCSKCLISLDEMDDHKMDDTPVQYPRTPDD